MGTKKRTHL